MSKAVSLEVVTPKPVKIPALIHGDDDAVAKRFGELFEDAQNGLRRIVTFGLFALETKLVHLKHGQFGDWVKGRFGEGAYRSVRSHLQLTESTLEACGIKKLKPIFQNGSALPISKHNDFLLLPDAKVPEALKPLRDKICSIVDGKSARALFTEFKQAEDMEDDKPLKSKRGRLKGQGGATKEQREAAAAREERERLESIQSKADETTDFLLEYSDVKGFAKLDEIDDGEKTLKKLADAVAYAHNFFTALKKSTK
jgi:hypothetical protein